MWKILQKDTGKIEITGRFIRYVTNAEIDMTLEDTGAYGAKLVRNRGVIYEKYWKKININIFYISNHMLQGTDLFIFAIFKI